MPDHLVLIRTGATEYDIQGRIRGSLDIPLAAEGLADARRAADVLREAPPAAIYTSTSSCAIETARIIGEACGLRPRRVPNLENLDQGLWQGMLVDELRRKQPRLYRQGIDDPWTVSPPEGERLEQACDRVEGAIHRICRRHATGSVALIVPRPLDGIVRWLVSGELIAGLWECDPATDVAVRIALAAQWKSSLRRQKQPF